ncbi:DNA/RNA helicase domain-containing protein [Actinosynnema sp. CS-041913]|uniref:DNA/RNA helicase domain-containing protein n=1 Tax=Actinosynnema sp. CS-041913 TaxID=3239917 RepID=UPI003D91895B
MHVYGGTVRDAGEALRSDLDGFVTGCVDRFRRRRGEPPEDGEVASWRKSWPVLVRALLKAGSADLGLLLEFELPGTGERVDAVVMGVRPDGGLTGVVVELKQWDRFRRADSTEVEIARGVERVHPCRQAAGYTSYLETWLEDATLDLRFRGVAVLHNAGTDMAARLRAEVAGRPGSGDVPIVSAGDLTDTAPHELAALLRCDDLRSPAEEQLARFLAVEHRPSPKLFAELRAILAQKSEFILVGAQQAAQLRVAKAVAEASPDRRRVIAVTGGPGTGKTVIALRLLADIPNLASAAGPLSARLLTPSGTLMDQLERALEEQTRTRGLFAYPDARLGEDTVPLVDEAQRLRRDPRLVTALIRNAPVSVFLLDERQVIRPNEGVTVEELRHIADREGADFRHVELTGQFRCGGSQAYLNWLGKLLSADDVAEPWTGSDYDVGVASDPDDLERWIRRHGSAGHTARIAAGFCWPWPKRAAGRPLHDDVVITWTDGGERTWRRPWNASRVHRGPDGEVLAPKRTFWATDPGGQNQVGCIYTSQGLEYDYGGVILGPDLVRRDDRWVADPDQSHDQALNGLPPDRYLPLALNTYWVLASRATLGCRFYSTDPETQRFLAGLC